MIHTIGAGHPAALGREHLPLRPLWRCTTCTWPWPCPPARRRLTDAYPLLHLAVYLGTCYIDAITDRPDLHPDVLYHRILGWLGPRHHTHRPPAPPAVTHCRPRPAAAGHRSRRHRPP